MDVLDPRDPDPQVRRQVAIWLAIQQRFALRPQALPHALREASEAFEVPDLAQLRLPPLSPARVTEACRQLARVGARLVPIASPLYPLRLRRLEDPPPVLVVRGNPALLHARCVAVVGSRAATAYGRSVAREWAGCWARAGLVIVSGLARGVDAAAHEGALQAGGATVAFLACGCERIYPPEHRGLAERVIGQGSLVTELPLGTPPRAPYFPLRNRLISAVSEAVVVVEGRVRSGTLWTARHAAVQGVDVYAVPGPVRAPTSAGPHALLRDGARPLTRASDLLADLGLEPVPEPEAVPLRAAAAEEGPLAEAALATLLSEGPATRDALARHLGVSPGALALALLPLELAGRVALDRDGRLTRVEE